MKIVARILPVALSLALLVPLLTFAQGGPGNLTSVSNFLNNIVRFINNTLVPLIFALAFLVFLWGMFQTFILGGDDEEKQSKGKQLMMYAIAGFVVMVSVWGIVNLVANGFGFTDRNIQNIPNVPTR